MEFASIDFPVPGSPISIICLFWAAAFFMTSTALSWPMTRSDIFCGTSTSFVDLNSCFSIHSSTVTSERTRSFSSLFSVPAPPFSS